MSEIRCDMCKEIIAGESFENVAEFCCFAMIELVAEEIRKCIPGLCMGTEVSPSV
jgi:hypothetical protein